MHFVLQHSRDGQYFFEIKAEGNTASLATSETYRSKADAEAAISLIQDEAGSADVIDETEALGQDGYVPAAGR
jgi:uncharacterized protein YegP (UPF0339 family)